MWLSCLITAFAKASPYRIAARGCFCIGDIITLAYLSARRLHADSQLVGNHGDKFRIGRLSSGVVYGVSEIGIEYLDIASVPRNFDGVTDCSLHARGGGIKLLRHAGI